MARRWLGGAGARGAPAAAAAPELAEPQLGKLRAAADRPGVNVLVLLAALAVALAGAKGIHPVAQTTANGLVSGAYYALGAAGLTLVYGVLKLINFAHGDMLTLGAYIALVVSTQLHVPVAVGGAAAIVGVGLLGVVLERIMWRPMRRRGAGMFQLVLMALGLAFVIRNGIQFFAGPDQRTLGVNVTATVQFLQIRLGRTELVVLLVGLAVLLGLGLMLKFTSLGKQVRALSDNPELAETTGIDTQRLIAVTWLLAGGLAALAGVLYGASVGGVNPNLGFGIVLTLFVAVVVGGIGNAYGALAGGLMIGVVEEWSTLVITPSLKIAVGFAMLVVVLIARPQGLFGRARAVDR